LADLGFILISLMCQKEVFHPFDAELDMNESKKKGFECPSGSQ
jgi:hypothetical protein